MEAIARAPRAAQLDVMMFELGWRQSFSGLWYCPACVNERLIRQSGHPVYGHKTEFRSDDSVWCFDCGGVVAVADG
jgi:hypothetical protein